MKRVTIDGRAYITVRAINNGCEDCVARDAYDSRCDRLKTRAPESKGFWCYDIVWIEDTEEAKAAHAVKVMEAS